MRVNWKTGLIFPGFFAVSLVLAVSAGCSKTDLSGSLIIVSGDADNPLKGADPYVVVLQSIGRSRKSAPEDTAGVSVSFGAESRNGGAARTGKARGRAPEFVPDEIIVKYKPGVDPGAIAKVPASRRYAEARSDRNTPRGTTSLLRLSRTARGALSEKAVRDQTLSEIDLIRSNPLVEYAEPNYIYRAFFAPNDPLYPLQWHYPLINLNELWIDDALWTQVEDLSGITVAVIDTGIAGGVVGAREDLNDTPTLFRDQYDFQGNSLSDPDDDDAIAEDPGPSYHGTHVTGTIAAITNNPTPTGVAGVAGGGGSGKGVRIMPVRALSDAGGTVYDISRAVLYAAGLGTDPVPPPKANIINMSLGGNGSSETLAQAIEDAHTAGLVIVAAAGNDATDLPTYPAAYPEVISVGAVTPGAEKAYYSNFRSGLGGKLDISAPGGTGIDRVKIDLNFDTYADDVLSTSGVSGYAYAAGTSMATPHAAGAAALVRKALQAAGYPDPSPSQIKSILASTAGPLGSADFYGAGLLDVCKAVRTALGSPPSRPLLSCSPKTLRLYGNPPQGTFVVKNTGDKTVAVDVAAAVVDQSTAGFIDTVTPGSATIPPGSNGITFTVTASPGPFPPSLRYAAIELTSPGAETGWVYAEHKDIGAVYAVVFEVITFSPFETVPVTSVAASPCDGFGFSFGGLDKGYYLIGASTDRDGDGEVFDAGEAYGFYGAPDYDHATLVSLEAGDELSALDFQIIDWE
jgi:serine protease